MEARKIDRLFKKGLSSVEDHAAVDSWAKMELMLDEKASKGGKVYWYVAASVALILAAAWFFPKTSDEGQVVETMVKEPIETTKPQETEKSIEVASREITPLAEANESVVINETSKKSQERVITQEPFSRPEEPLMRSAAISQPEQPIIQEPENITPEVEPAEMEQQPKKRMPVRITYKRSNRMTDAQNLAGVEQDTTKKKLKQFLDKNNIDPSEMWADIRDTKDRLVQKAVDFKNKNVKTQNK